MAEKQTVQVTIFHQTYTLRAAGDEHDIQELADTVDQLMSDIAGHLPNADALRIAVLACLHLADRLRSLEGELDQLKQRVAQKSEQFRLLLERAIEAGQE